MRELDAEERELMRRLDGVIPTDQLIQMVRDLSEVLAKEGLVVRARVAEVAATRLDSLHNHRPRQS
jgi:hypothetical protein